MVQVKVAGNWYSIANCWEDANPYKLLSCETSKDELKALSTIPATIIDAAEDLDLFPLYTTISFLTEEETLPYYKAPGIDVFGSYNSFEIARRGLGVGKPYQNAIQAAMVYYPELRDCKLLVGLGVSIIQQIHLFLESYQEMNQDKPTASEQQAAEEFDLGTFGHWGTAYNLAGRDLDKVDEVLNMPALKIYTALYFSWKEAKYNKRKFELDHPPRI